MLANKINSNTETGTLYTSYFAKVKYGKGHKFSIARYNPKWLNNSMIENTLINLAPSSNLLWRYKNNSVNWEEYTKEYQIQLVTNGKQELKNIEHMLMKGENVTLYCYEKPSDDCHRHIIADYFSARGYKVKEIEF